MKAPITTAVEPSKGEDSWPSLQRWEWLLLAAVLVAIAVTRFPTLHQRLLEAHAFRQTQTAYQTLEFHRGGIDLLRPLVPVLGSPWSIPFEFPLFQALASVVMSFGIGADAANRLTGLGFFVLTAVALWALIRLVADRRTAAIGLVVFSFSPLAMLWSRASLIEYLATAAAIGWVISTIRWRQTSNWKWGIPGVLLGAIAITVKVTSAVPWLAPILLFRPKEETPSRIGSRQWFQRRLRWPYLAMLIVPALASLAWTLHSDAVKAASPTTAWLTSGALRTWNLGTISQRLSTTNLDTIFGRIDSLILGRGWLVIAVVAAIAVKRHRAFWIGTLLVPLLAIGTFFNLYVVHDYYLVAISPALAALLALGIRSTTDWLRIGRRWIMPTLGAMTILWVGLALGFSQNYWTKAYTDLGPQGGAGEIASLTTPDEYSMVLAGDHWNWSAQILYYAERRGMMLREPPLTVPLMAMQPDLERYHLLWTSDPTGPGVEYASVRPWYAPVSAYALLLGSDAGDLGQVDARGSTRFLRPPDGPTQEIDIETTTIACDGTDKVLIPGGPGSVWLSTSAEGGARASLIDGFVTVPSATRTMVWSPDPSSGVRPEQRLVCFGGGQLSIDSAVVANSGT